jgi:WD40 repeat protein
VEHERNRAKTEGHVSADRTMINRRRWVPLSIVGLVSIGTVAAILSQVSNRDLLEELKARGVADGLALISTRAGNHWDLVPLAGEPSSIDNPRSISAATLSANGNIVAWEIASWPGEQFAACPSPIIVETVEGIPVWQVPGNVINSAATAVSDDGRRVAFDGTYKPNGTGFLNTRSNRERWITGLQLADRATNSVSLILPLKDSFDGRPVDHIGRISFAPDGNRFVYDFHDQIHVYDISTKSTTRLASGSNPAWSSDGKWIGFRAPNGEAHLIDPKTNESRTLIGIPTIVWGIHWSPDSQYLMFGEHPRGWIPLVSPSTHLIVYRLRDGANVRVYGFGYTDQGSDGAFFWVKNSQRFITNALIPPKIKPCDSP